MPYADPGRQKAALRGYARRDRAVNMERIMSALGLSGCVRCGESDVIVLQWHHRVPSEKSFNVLTGSRNALSTRIAEARKCDLLCANCHLRVHEEMRTAP
jgi:hypothetical protein